ncbi:hypothetical protein [Dyadobacter sp. CY351]|uniref:hypothetical protein n=1 Tax=Dyadobacter sp. CY351 TaxID=2909337 RepID=UPI001F426631|nr:hypothetical protein [Dyadobacter sp. CY351]MCF2520943.1 hypothetical protein [Dyadobacter sp. CY351]
MKNPHAANPGDPLPGQLSEFIEWEKEQLARVYLEHLQTKDIVDDEIEVSLHAKRSVRRRWQSESGYVSIRHEVAQLVTFIEENLNPHSKPSGAPKEGMQAEWLVKNIEKWEEYLERLPQSNWEVEQMHQEIYSRWHSIAGISHKTFSLDR